MRRSITIAVLALLFLGAPAAAQAAGSGPTLERARIEITPDTGTGSTQVHASITLSGVRAGRRLKHLLPRFEGVGVGPLHVTSTRHRLHARSEPGHGSDTITFTAPTAGKLRYDVRYRVTPAHGQAKVPVIVPAYPGDGGKVARLIYHVPKGYHVQGEPFPVVIGSTGSPSRDLAGVPSFVDYRISNRPSTGPGTFTLVGLAIIVIGVTMSIIVMARDSRAARKA